MPITNFASVQKFFNIKTGSNTKTEPASPTGIRSNKLVAPSQLGASAAQTPPQPRDPTTSDRDKGRLPYANNLEGDARIGTVLTSDLWMEQGRALTLHAGPSQASWSLALRASDEEIKAGHARFAAARQSIGSRGSRSTYLDFPKIGFSFQSGNILPIYNSGNEVTVPYGLEDFYAMTELLDQPPLLPSGTREGKHNYVWLFYTSLQLPQAVLKGYFEPGGMTWTDDAGEPASLTWNMDFIAHEMTPEFGLTNELTDAYANFMREYPNARRV